MIALDPSDLSPQAQRVVAPGAPAKMQELAARGVVPGLRPADLLVVLVALTGSERPEIAAMADGTLGALPEPLLQGALAADLPAACIDAVAQRYAANADVVQRLLSMPRVALETVEQLARAGTEAVTELVATNEERLLAHPRLIELLYLNRHTRMSTADRIVELASRNGVELRGLGAWDEVKAAVAEELIVEPGEETPDDVLFRETHDLAEALASAVAEDEDAVEIAEDGKEVVRDKLLPVYQRIANMTTSQKVRRAILGSREERLLLVRDTNRIVSESAVRSPLMQEPEAVMIARSRQVPGEVLRIIANNKAFAKSYVLKRNLVENPKTPVSEALKLIPHMRESDLRQISKSKNVTGPIQDAARRHLARRQG